MPRYNHDCKKCTFLGEFEEYDLYFCSRGEHSMIIAKYGDDDYFRGLASESFSKIEVLEIAKCRAIEQGLL